MNDDDKLRIYEWAKRDKRATSSTIETMIWMTITSVTAAICTSIILIELFYQP